MLGEFVINKPKNKLKDKHYATITVVDAVNGVHRWITESKAGTLTPVSSESPDKLEFSEDCLFYKNNHTVATLKFDKKGNIAAIVGLNDKIYYRYV